MDYYVFEVSPRSYLLKCSELPGSVCDDPDYCLFGITNMDSELGEQNQKLFILGSVFLKNFYTVYNATEGDANLQIAVSKSIVPDTLGAEREGEASGIQGSSIKNLSSKTAPYVLMMFLTYIVTGTILHSKFKSEKDKMYKKVKNTRIIQ